LWLAYNSVLYCADDNAASVAAQARVGELTGYLQPTDTLGALVIAAREHQCVMLTGPRGSGKSTLAAALAQPAAAGGHVPDGFVDAIAFATSTSTMDTLSAALAGSLRVSVDGFARAVNEFDARLDAAEREGLPALQRRVMGPLRLMKLQRPVRLVIDALDELPEATQQVLRRAVCDARAGGDGEPETAGLRFVLTARPGAPALPGACLISVATPGDDVIGAYLLRRDIRDEHIPLLVNKADGNWLHAYLLAERAVRPGFDPGQLPIGIHPSLAELYATELLAVGAGDRDRWETQLRPVLAVCATAGVGPVLPLPLAVAAAARLGGPSTPTRFLDSVVRLSGLIVRAKPGQPGEQLGMFHLSLAEDYLLRPDLAGQFTIDAPEAHRALADALRELAPAEQHDPNNPLHNYALRAEPEHLWAGGHTADVINSLARRPLPRAVDEMERWQRWKTRLDDALGPNHPDTLTARANLALFTGTAGHPAAARDQYTALLPTIAGVFGPRHPDTLTARANLARFTGEAGDPVAARDQYTALLPTLEEVLGPRHPDTLSDRANLARTTGEAGDPAAARDQYTALLPTRVEVSGPTHPDTLAARANLAHCTGAAGDPVAARDQFTALLPILEEVSGPRHPNTLADRANLAYFTGEAGDPVAARDQCTALLPTIEEVLGPRHPDTLAGRANLAHWTALASGSE
jgi:hypothetical protein